MNKKLTKQFVVSVYADGTVKITERAVTPRGSHGHFTGKKTRVLGTSVCPVCHTPLRIEF